MWTRRLLGWISRRGWDDLLQVTGLGGIIYVTVASSTPRPALVAAFGAMMGLPYFTGRDKARRRRRLELSLRVRDEPDEDRSGERPIDAAPPSDGSAPPGSSPPS